VSNGHVEVSHHGSNAHVCRHSGSRYPRLGSTFALWTHSCSSRLSHRTPNAVVAAMPIVLASAAVVFAIGLVQFAGAVVKHSQFKYQKESGTIELVADPSLRLNVAGGELKQGDPLVLFPCVPQAHELFTLEDGVIKLQHSQSLCLNAAGTNDGAKIVIWHCGQPGDRVVHPEFVLGKDGRIRLRQRPKMCINAGSGRLTMGTHLMLFPCATDTAHPNEVFVFKDGLIQLKFQPTLHFNIMGVEMALSSEVVLWSCQASSHEIFEFREGRLHMKNQPDMCITAEGGVVNGHRLVAWPCSTDVPASNELFSYDAERQVIYSGDDPNMGFNVKGGVMSAGGQIILWPLAKDEL